MTETGILARFRCSLDTFRLDVDLTLPAHGVIALFGHSGCGKTTLLRCMAGLQPAEGHMRVNGQRWQDAHHSLAVHQRPLAYVFQEPSLFPHLSVRGNLNYGLRRTPRDQRQIGFEQAVAWLGLADLLERMPGRLSGGERQRVAIARALLTSPRLLLMDEPLSALDRPSKQEILPYLENLHRSLAIPVVYVSHSVAEVARLADHVVMMEHGRVVAEGPLQETLARTDQPFALEEDAGVLVNATLRQHDAQWHLYQAEFEGGSLWVRDEPGLAVGRSVRLQVLARDISLALAPNHDQSIQNLISARVTDIVTDQSPGTTMVRLQAGSTPFLARLTSRSAHQLKLAPGMDVWMQIKTVAIVD
ncbi:MAG: molybdenum ABC transporter ATP-binding protein [Pseudomonadota bacterium]